MAESAELRSVQKQLKNNCLGFSLAQWFFKLMEVIKLIEGKKKQLSNVQALSPITV